METLKKCDYFESGEIETEEWYVNNKLHRTDGPAQIEYYKSGKIMSEFWYEKGELHREDGPAKIWYSESGRELARIYYFNGVGFHLPSDSEYRESPGLLLIEEVMEQ